MTPSIFRPLALAVAIVAVAACHRTATVGSPTPATGTGPATATKTVPAPASKASGLPSSVTPAMIDSGKVLFAGACQRCHGPAGAGATNAPPLNDEKWNQPIDGSFDSIVKIITDGVPMANIKGGFPYAMRPLGGRQFTADQVRMIAGYVYTLSHK